MSRGPSPEGAKEIIELVRRIDTLLMEEKDLRRKTKRLRDVIDSRQELQAQLFSLLESMDVEEPGNAGWPGRFSWLLAEIVRQASEKPTMTTEEANRLVSDMMSGPAPAGKEKLPDRLSCGCPIGRHPDQENPDKDCMPDSIRCSLGWGRLKQAHEMIKKEKD